MQAVSSSHISRSDPLERSFDGWLRVPILPKDLGQSQRAFEHVQTELLLQSRRQDELFETVARVEADLSRVAKLAVENEGLHAKERHQKQEALSSLSRKTEDALLMCDAVRKSQEHLMQKVERLEAFAEDREHQAEEVRILKREVDALQGTVREKLDSFGHALRRLDAMELIFDENTKLRQEVAQLRRANERRDLEMAAVQGQIDALTKLVREQLREPLSPRKGDASLVC
jgi:chromosome segregation ATPase